ncbi:hypothetical protein TNCV_2844131 [Trichonephila clavipes]|nr:hypothetical protein TNCV_2844131 [Trichonephila clavipes]
MASRVESLLEMKHGSPISSRNQSKIQWNGDIHPLPSRSKPSKRCQYAIFWQQCTGTGTDFTGGLNATRNNDQLSCLLHNSTEAPKSIAKQTAWHAVISPDLAPRDFHLFWYLKHSLSGKRFNDNEEVKLAVSYWLSNQAADVFEEGFQNLVLRYRSLSWHYFPRCGDRFNSCQVIYSEFGLAIHQNDHQARSRFVEWAQNEIAVVPDFHKRILFSDEAHFWLNGYVNKQNCRIWSEANPQVYVETPLHPEKLTVW